MAGTIYFDLADLSVLLLYPASLDDAQKTAYISDSDHCIRHCRPDLFWNRMDWSIQYKPVSKRP